MISVILVLLAIASVALIGARLRGYLWVPQPSILGRPLPGFLYDGAFGVLALLASYIAVSIVQPGGNQIAQFDRIYFCSPIKDGRNIALEGECGRQAKTMMPGLHFSPFVKVLYNVDYIDMVDVPEGHYAVLNARDGLKLDEGQVAAKPWFLGNNTFKNQAGKEVSGNMLDATFFLTEGMGRKGPQATILTPGRYPVNQYLWDIQMDRPVTDEKDKKTKTTEKFVRKTIAPGFVGVVKSAIDEDVLPSFVLNKGATVHCSPEKAEEKDLGQIKAVLVPVGCRGVWKDPLPPGDYFINSRIYSVQDVDTRLANWTYQGGYTRRYINLSVAENGTITQMTPNPELVPKPEGAAGEAVAVAVEGWTVYQEIRLQARVKPEDAPLVVAAVGGPQEVEDRTITPQVRSVLRNIGGSRITVQNTAAYEEAKSEMDALTARLAVLKDSSADVGLNAEQRASEVAQLERQVASLKLPNPTEKVTRPTRVLDFQNEREALEALVSKEIKKFGAEAGIEIVNVTFGNADIPPELLVARKIEQLSGQLRNAYLQKRIAQVQRQATESAQARADQQKDLVTAQIGVETSKLGIESRTNNGLAEQKYLEALAKGQEAQANVLGPDRVLMFNVISEILKHPEAIAALNLPNTLTISGGQGGGLESLATILGSTKLFGGPIDTLKK